MTSLKHSEAQTNPNSTCFSLGMGESSEESKNSQHLYPGILVSFFILCNYIIRERKKRPAEVRLFCSGVLWGGIFLL